jgi:hypothetical protein
MIDGHRITCDPEPATAEALFKEAKRRERLRRLGIAAIALLVAVGALLAATIGGSKSPRPVRGDTSGPRSSGPAPTVRLWSQTAILKAGLADTPVALPGSPFAYGITVASDTPTSPWGRLTRLDLATGRVTAGPKVPLGSELFTLGNSLRVLSPAGVSAKDQPTGPWSIRQVMGQSVSLGTAVVLSRSNFRPDAEAVPVSDGPPVGRDGLWIVGGEKSVSLVSATTGAIIRTVDLTGTISSISIDPTGKFLYVSLNELISDPTAAVSTVIDELDAATGRLVAHAGIRFTLGWANLDAVRGGVWVSYRGGSMGGVVLLRAAGLGNAPGTKGRTDEVIPTMGVPITMGVSSVQVGPVIWLSAALGTSCVAPSSGAFRAGTVFPTRNGQTMQWYPFHDWNGHLYATQGVPGAPQTTEIVSVAVPRVCR